MKSMWSRRVVLALLSLYLHIGVNAYSSNELRCQICLNVIKEMKSEVGKVSPTLQTKTAGYQVDGKGNRETKYTPLVKSDIFLTELMEKVCVKMDDYARATSKTTGELELIKLMTEDGKMTSRMSEVDLISDSDLNKSLKFYCDDIVDEFEEIILGVFKSDSEIVDTAVCAEEIQLCQFTESEIRSEL